MRDRVRRDAASASEEREEEKKKFKEDERRHKEEERRAKEEEDDARRAKKAQEKAARQARLLPFLCSLPLRVRSDACPEAAACSGATPGEQVALGRALARAHARGTSASCKAAWLPHGNSCARMPCQDWRWGKPNRKSINQSGSGAGSAGGAAGGGARRAGGARRGRGRGACRAHRRLLRQVSQARGPTL